MAGRRQVGLGIQTQAGKAGSVQQRSCGQEAGGRDKSSSPGTACLFFREATPETAHQTNSVSDK